MNIRIVKYTPRNHGLVTGAHGPGNHSGPSSGRPRRPSGETPLCSRGPAPYHRNSASLEGWTPPRGKLHLARGLDAPSSETPPLSRDGRPLGQNSASLEGCTRPRVGFRLARGLCAPSGGFPPRSRPSRVRRSRTHSADRSIKCSNMTWAPRSKVNPHHADPLTPPGNHIPTMFHHPRHCTTLCGKARVSSVTLCRPLLYDPYATPSKEYGKTLEKGTNACLAPARDDVMTSDQ
jgi:hypothetical protein